MKKLFMKLCGQDRKLRSSQTLKPMRVITKVSRCTVETFYTEDKMTYQEWIAYIKLKYSRNNIWNCTAILSNNSNNFKMKHKYKIEYLNLCTIFGHVEVDSVISFNMYCNQRETLSQQTIYNSIEEIMQIDK